MTDKTEPAPMLVSAKDAAKSLGISDRTLWTMTKAGIIPHVPIGHRVLYDPEDLREWIKRNKRNADPKPTC